MASAGEGPSAAPSSGYGSNGGVGGKFRKRPFRKTNTTPYDRPPTALRNPSWLSKLVVEPASKLIASGAQRFFAPLFRKRLTPAPPPPPEFNQVSSDEQPETVREPEVAVAAVGEGENFTQRPSSGGISDLEQLLRKKTFTRSEIDHLTELLHSRAEDMSRKNDFKRTEANSEKLVANPERQQQLVSPSEEKRTQYNVSHGLISTPGISARVLEEDIASPAEIARAYMGDQASKVSPSMLGLRARAVREDSTFLSNVSFTPKSTMTPLTTKAGSLGEVPENGYTTPRSRGRSAIYNMARTPYSRVHPTAFEKGSGSMLYGFGGPSLPAPSVKELNRESGANRLALKRRSSALDDDVGSVGPMRRTRQKAGMLSHRTLIPQGIGAVSAARQHPFTDERVYKGLKVNGENDDNRTPRTSYAHVPPKSTEMATKILEHLEKMTPKTKSAELKLNAAKEKSPAKLTTDMLRGRALKSLEDANSSKLLYGDYVGNKLDGGSPSKQVTSVSTLQEKDRTEENVLQKLDSRSKVATLPERTDATTSVKGIFTSVEASHSVAKAVAQQPKKKQAFMMSAHEDLDLDDDTNFDGTTSKVLPKVDANRENIENRNLASVETSLPNKPPVFPETRTLAEPTSGQQLDSESVDAANVGQGKTGTAPFSVASNAASPLFTTPPSSLESDNLKQASNKVLGSDNSSSLPVAEPADLKPWSFAHPKPDALSSAEGVATNVTGASFRIPVSEKVGDNNIQEFIKTNGKLDTASSAIFSSSSSSGISSIFPNSSSNNGLPTASPFTFSSMSTSASTGTANSFPSNGSSNLASSVSTSSSAATASFLSASSSVPFSSTEAAVFPKKPIFSSVSSGNPSVSAFSVSNAETPDTKTGKESNAGNSSNVPFGGSTLFAPTGTGSSIFGLSKVTSSTAGSQSQDSLSSSGSGSMHNVQTSVAGSAIASVTATMPVQFGSSAPSLNFGTSTSGNTLFSSTTTTAKPFGQGTDSGGLSSSASLPETKSLGPSNGATSSIFNFHANASSSSSATNVISSNSGSAPFSFGASTSSTESSVTNAISSSTAAASPPPLFSFGASSSAGNVASSSSGGAGIFGVGPLTSSTETTTASSSSAATSLFGGSWAAPKSSPFGSTFNSFPSTGNTFWGSSSFGSTNSAPMVFGSSTSGSSSGPVNMTAASTSSSPSVFGAQPVFGGSTPSFTAAAGANNDQMNTEDSMAEDPVNSSMPVAAPVFGQQPPVSASPGGYMFGSSVASQANPFQFGGQQNQSGSQSTPPLFQASGSQEFGSAGGSFSLGSGGMGGDKSGRKFIKVNRNRNRKK